MTRRSLLASFFLLPVVRALDLVKVTVKVTVKNEVRESVWWGPRAVADERFRRVLSCFARNRNKKRLQVVRKFTLVD